MGSNLQINPYYLRERTAQPRPWRLRSRAVQCLLPKPKLKPQADDEPFVSPDHIHPVVFNKGVMLRTPMPF